MSRAIRPDVRARFEEIRRRAMARVDAEREALTTRRDPAAQRHDSHAARGGRATARLRRRGPVLPQSLDLDIQNNEE